MTLHPFPEESRARWRRLDVPGREEACVERTISGWRLTGELDVEEAGLAAQLRYTIDCDPEWRTRSALVEGEAGGAPIRFALAADGAGQWTRDGTPLPDLSGALDVDLGFTPATNTLPIRRLALAVGESAPVRSAWLRFPELRLEPLEQTYTREAEQSFRYRAIVDGEPFIARLDTDVFGRVVRYEGLWEIELATPDQRLLEALLDSWDRNNTILLNLLRALPDGGLEARATEDSPSIAELVIHIHYVRLVFVLEDAPELARDLPREEWAAERDPGRITDMLNDSAKAVRDAVRSRVETGQDMDLHYDHPILLLQHMLWHEGYHHGQMKLALKVAGRPMDDEEAGPVTWDVWMRKK